MIIVQINAVYGYGSTGKICKDISDYVNNHTESTVISFFNNGQEDEFSIKFGNIFDRKLHGFLSRLTGRQGSFSKFSTNELLKKIKIIKPDVCILHNIHSNSLNFQALFSFMKKHNIPVFLYLHDCYFYTGKCVYYTENSCNKWRSQCCSCPRFRIDNPSWFFDTSKQMFLEKKNCYLKNNIYVVGVSEWISNEAKSSALLGGYPIKRIYNWVDFSVYNQKNIKNSYPAELSEFVDKKIILGVANDWDKDTWKGLAFFEELSLNLSNDYKIVLVGKCSKKKSKSIYYFGSVKNSEQLSQLYNISEVFINYSIQESFGLVSAEAISCGTPVVALNSTANSELIKDGCGILIDNKENIIKQTIDAIEFVTKKGKESFSKKCISFAHSNFDKEKNIESLLEYIKNVVSNVK